MDLLDPRLRDIVVNKIARCLWIRLALAATCKRLHTLLAFSAEKYALLNQTMTFLQLHWSWDEMTELFQNNDDPAKMIIVKCLTPKSNWHDIPSSDQITLYIRKGWSRSETNDRFRIFIPRFLKIPSTRLRLDDIFGNLAHIFGCDCTDCDPYNDLSAFETRPGLIRGLEHWHAGEKTDTLNPFNYISNELIK